MRNSLINRALVAKTKLFNYALLAAALLIGVNVNAASVKFVVKNGDATVGTSQTTLQGALDLITVEDATNWTITLSGANYNVPEATEITYDFKGATLSLGKYLNVNAAGSYTFKNAKITGSSYIYQQTVASTIILDNVQMTTTGTYAIYNKIAAANLSLVNGSSASLKMDKAMTSISVEGGSSLELVSGTFTNVAFTGLENCVVTAGTFAIASYDIVKDRLAEGKYLFRKASTCVVGTEEQATAKIGEELFLTVADAFACAEEGATITLLAEVTGQAAMTINKNITIDFNGFNYSLSTAKKTLFTINAEKTLTLINSGANQVTVSNVGNTAGTSYRVASVSGALVVEGDIKLDASATGATGDVYFAANGASVEAKEGAEFNVSLYSKAYEVTLDVDDESTVNLVSGFAAKNDTKFYPTVAKAFEKAEDDETIVLLAEATGQAAKTISKNITIDLNGFNYSLSTAKYTLFTVSAGKTLNLINSGANQVTVSNVGTTAGASYRIAAVSGNLVVDGDIVFDASATGATGDISIATDGASVTINGDAKVSVNGTKFGYLDGDSQNITIVAGNRFWTLPEHYTMDPALSGKKYIETQTAGGDSYYLLIDNNAGPIAELNGTKYYALGDALNAAQDGETIKLCSASTEATTYAQAFLYSGKKVILDLNGRTLNAEGMNPFIQVIRGELTITGSGKLMNKTNDADCIRISGSYWPIMEGETPSVFSKLVIDEDVTVEGTGCAVQVYSRPAGYITAEGEFVLGGGNKFLKDLSIPAGVTEDNKFESTQFITGNSSWGVAENVFVDIKGTLYGGEKGIQVSGVIRMPKIMQADGTPITFRGDPNPPVSFTEADEPAFLACIPQMHIFPTAKCGAGNEYGADKTGSGVYAAGYAHWVIEGECYGATGVYIKSGEVDIDGAYIYSTWTSDVKDTEATGSGTKSGGNGVVVESNKSYKGETSVTIEGDTKIQGGSGYGIEQTVTNGDPDQLNIIDIQGGEIGKGGEGTFIINSENTDDVVISAGSSETGGSVETWTIINKTDPDHPTTTDVTVDQFIPTDPQSGEPTSHIIYVYNESGELAFVVVVPGATPQTPADCGSFDLTTYAGQSIDFAECEKEQALAADLTLEEVIMNSATEAQKVIVNDGATLTIKYLVMGPKSNITVEPGGTLIVSGDMGVKNVSASNITIQAQEGKSGKFLFAPEVKSNRHPHATVTFFSKAFTNSKADQQQDFIGIPMQNVKNITISDPAKSAVFDIWRRTYWDRIGGINFNPALDYNKFDIPFGLYRIFSNNTKDQKLSYDISGELLGNTEPSSLLILKEWTSAANSWTGDIDFDAIMQALKDNTFEGLSWSIYLGKIEGSVITWNAYNETTDNNPTVVEPMQAMMLYNGGNQAVNARILTYKELVWDPVMNPAPAPRRAPVIADKVTINVTSETGITDRVVVAVADEEYSAPKYMSNPVCVYAHAGESYDILATSTVANTYVGFNCEKEGTYTISFGKVNGTYALLDLMNNARIEMTEGATYQFNANANEKNEYRFMIVESAKVPTAMDKVNAKANAVKVISNGEFRIVKENRVYNAMGEEL